MKIKFFSNIIVFLLLIGSVFAVAGVNLGDGSGVPGIVYWNYVLDKPFSYLSSDFYVESDTLYSNVTGGSGGALVLESFTGSDATDSDGDINRNITCLNTPKIVAVDNYNLHPDSDYILNGKTITFSNKIWDSMYIDVWSSSDIEYININPSTLSDETGDANRSIVFTNSPKIVVVDNFNLHIGSDYTYVGTTLKFSNHIWDEMKITVWY